MKRSKISQKMMDRWEGSKADKSKDKREAAKRGMTMAQWEKSAADKRMDRAEIRKRKK